MSKQSCIKHMWQPSANIESLRHRANVIKIIRAFFEKRHILEVDTPLLAHHTVTDPALHSFKTHYHPSCETEETLYLQTSPEFFMKRLLAAGSGPIYQITHAFRDHGEKGRWHNPEFTMLEWYRVGFQLSDLMDETEQLLQEVLHCPKAKRFSYAQFFKMAFNLDPHQVHVEKIKEILVAQGIHLEPLDWINSSDTGLQILLDYYLHTQRQQDQLLFIYDFPISQAALAKIKTEPYPVAERFEAYYNGVELANGFYELQDPKEQEKRFLQDLAIRKKEAMPLVSMDPYLLEALRQGLPDCSGIALGVDRLVALARKVDNLSATLSFAIERA